MGQIFISYSSKDAPFAMTLSESLSPFYDIWIDRDDIKGGSEWEKMIQEAIKSCDVFLIIVSNNSNDSNWVMRETIFAESLKKYRIPVMLNGSMPFRLLELQYIDFQGDYSGGLRDLLAVLQSQIAPENNAHDEIDRMIGAGVRAYFDHKFVSANNLFEQVTILNPESKENIMRLSNFLAEQFEQKDISSTFPLDLMSSISILEKAKVSANELYGQDTAYEWSLELNTSDDILQQIDFVKYILHTTFIQPERNIRNRKSNFKLEMIGWGTFEVNIEIHFIDGTIAKTSHELTFESAFDD